MRGLAVAMVLAGMVTLCLLWAVFVVQIARERDFWAAAIAAGVGLVFWGGMLAAALSAGA